MLFFCIKSFRNSNYKVCIHKVIQLQHLKYHPLLNKIKTIKNWKLKQSIVCVFVNFFLDVQCNKNKMKKKKKNIWWLFTIRPTIKINLSILKRKYVGGLNSTTFYYFKLHQMFLSLNLNWRTLMCSYMK